MDCVEQGQVIDTRPPRRLEEEVRRLKGGGDGSFRNRMMKAFSNQNLLPCSILRALMCLHDIKMLTGVKREMANLAFQISVGLIGDSRIGQQSAFSF